MRLRVFQQHMEKFLSAFYLLNYAEIFVTQIFVTLLGIETFIEICHLSLDSVFSIWIFKPARKYNPKHMTDFSYDFYSI